MKKVIIINPYLPTLGGGEKHMGYLCQFIEEYYNGDVNIDILVHNYHKENIYDKNYVTIDKVNDVFGLNLQHTGIKKLNIGHAKNKIQFLKYKRMIENITKGYDICINFMFFSKHCAKGRVNIYQVMFPPKRFIEESPNASLPAKAVYRYFDRQFYKSYDKFVCNSNFTKGWLERYWQAGDKNCVIYPPVFSEDDKLCERYNESEKQNIIISVGRFFVKDHSKRQLDMVKFFVNNEEIFRNYEYHLVGNVSTLPEDIAYLNKIKTIAATVDNVYIHEKMDYEGLMGLYRKAKIFWHATGYGVDEEKEPWKMEHFGITTVEAMSYGAVPVVIDKGGQTEIVEEGVNGYRWLDEQGCVGKTQHLIGDDKLRRRMAEESVERAKLYSVDAFYERNRKLFQKLGI